MADKRKPRVLTLAVRLKMIKAVEDNPSKARTQIANEFDVPLPTLSNILREKNKYIKQAANGELVSTIKRARGSQLASVDKINYFSFGLVYLVQVGFSYFLKNFFFF